MKITSDLVLLSEHISTRSAAAPHSFRNGDGDMVHENSTMDEEEFRGNGNPNKNMWTSSGSKWKDYLHFCGPGWLVAIAYLDPGNTQADIQAGATGGYSQLWTFLWVTALSIYVQVLCARLSMVGQTTLSESMRGMIKHKWLRYVAWAIAEFSVIITDIPEVIGIGIAFNVFFGWPYYVGCLISPITTLIFLASQSTKGGMRWLEGVIVFLIGVMAVTIFIEWGLVDSDAAQVVEGLVYGFVNKDGRNLWVITGIIGAVVMPHNLYLHTASVLSRPVRRDTQTVKDATYWVSVEPIFPIMFSFLINIGIVIVAAVNVYGQPNADSVGNTDFASYLTGKVAPILWGVALLAAGQSSAVRMILFQQLRIQFHFVGNPNLFSELFFVFTNHICCLLPLLNTTEQNLRSRPLIPDSTSWMVFSK